MFNIYNGNNKKIVIFIIIIILFIISSLSTASDKVEELNVSEDEVLSIYKSSHSLIEEKKFDEAVGLLQQIVTRYPFSKLAPAAQFEIAHCYLKQGKQREALETLKNGIKKFPALKLMFEMDIPDIYWKQGMQSKAIQKREDYVKENPKTYFAFINELELGRYYKLSGNYKVAINKFQSVVENYPSLVNIKGYDDICAHALFEKGDCHAKLKEYDNASQSYQLLIDRFPKSIYVKNAKAEMENLHNKNIHLP